MYTKKADYNLAVIKSFIKAELISSQYISEIKEGKLSLLLETCTWVYFLQLK